MERAHQVLTRCGVNTSLAANGSINHGEQRGGNLNDLDATHPSGGHKARHISHCPAAKANNGIGAGEVLLAQTIPQCDRCCYLLAALCIGDFFNEDLQPLFPDARSELCCRFGDAWLVHHHNLVSAGSFRMLSDADVKTLVNDYLIGSWSIDCDCGP